MSENFYEHFGPLRPPTGILRVTPRPEDSRIMQMRQRRGWWILTLVSGRKFATKPPDWRIKEISR